jgi:UDP-N-acetylmuramoylalanine--D-glutamate ligase
MDLKNIRHIAVLGGGESGTGAAILAKKKGYEVFVSDASELKDHFREMLTKHGISFEENEHSEQKIISADLIIKSPGIPDKAPIIKAVKDKGIPVVSEIEFAFHFTKAKIIGITGSNGKTTTTLLTYHIFKNAGVDVACAGNVGNSFAMAICERDYEYIILELSSFQLDDIIDFKCHIAILLNITPDHLDRYHYNMNEYAASKFRIINKQTSGDYFIYDLDDEVTASFLPKYDIKARQIPISQIKKLSTGVYLENEHIKVNINDLKQITIPMNILSLIGTHNRYNSMAATAAASAIDIQDNDIRKSLTNFENIEHRLESVAKIHGTEFINDSKATNINATWYALESMEKSVIWIVGGIDKGNNYDDLKPLVREKVKAIVCLGVDNSKIIEAFEKDIQLIFDTGAMQEAVDIAFRLATEDDVVLLSPACASFDLFKNYEERGKQFKEAVKNL